jgi:hypothetical protein
MRLFKKKLVMILVIVALLTVGIMPIVGEEITGVKVYVSTTNGDDDDNDGSEKYPYATIERALDSVDDVGIIYIATGTYYENLTITKNVTLIGEDQETTIIDGSKSNRVMMIDDGDDGTMITVTIVGVTIQNGQTLEGEDGEKGADCSTYNSGETGGTGEAGEDGGGIYNKEKLSLKACTIKDNTTGTGGSGGIGGAGGTENIRGGTGGTGGTGGNGGGIYNTGTMIVQDSEIINNSAGNGGTGGDGGANSDNICAAGGTGGMGGNGGGIYNNGEMSVSYTTISNNIAGTGGTGGLGYGTGNMYNNTMVGGLTGRAGANGGNGGNGGGIVTIGSIEIISCNLTENSGGIGGSGRSGEVGVYSGNGGNGGAGGKGGAIYSDCTTSSSISISFITDNTVGLGGSGGNGGVRAMYTAGDVGDAGTDGTANSIYNNGEDLVAQNNWWGQNSGNDSSENIGNFTITKWMQLVVSLSNSDLLYEEEVDVTAQFMNNFGDQLTDSLFNSIMLDFSATNGSIDGQAYMIDSVATVAYQGTVSGVDTIFTTLDNETLSIEVNIAIMGIIETLPVGSLNFPYEGSFVATGQGKEPLTWSATGLPTGLELDANTGVISGTPIEAGEYSTNIFLTDSNGILVSKTCTITIQNSSGNGAFLFSTVMDSAYTSSTEDNLLMMTVNSGESGFMYFKVKISEVVGHEGDETVMFIQYRNDMKISISIFESDLATGDSVIAGFNVQAGDKIKVLIVDELSNDESIVSNIL